MHKHLEARLDILSDGVGGGGAAIFLTIHRCTTIASSCHEDPSSSSTRDDDDDEFYYQETPSPSSLQEEQDLTTTSNASSSTIVARYNLSGIPSLTGRLSSDQSYKMLQNGAFHTVLVPSFISSFSGNSDDHNNDDEEEGVIRGESIGGLPALFLNLLQAGYKIAGSSDGGGHNNNKTSLEYSSDSGVEEEDCEKKIAAATTGYNDVSIIGPIGINDAVDELLDIMFGNVRRRPSLRLCEVPTKTEWFEVYQDSYVCIWAQSIPHTWLCEARSSDCANDESNAAEKEEYSLAFIVMLRSPPSEIGMSKKKEGQQSQQFSAKRQRTTPPSSSQPYSFAILTQPIHSRQKTCQKCENNTTCNNDNFQAWNVFRHLPEEIMSNRKESSSLLDFILHLNPVIGEKVHSKDKNVGGDNAEEECANAKQRVVRRRMHVPDWVIDAKLAKYHFALFRDLSANESPDDGLLIRAWHRSKILHEALPFAFPLKVQETIQEKEQTSKPDYGQVDDVNNTTVLRLSSCTSVILNGWGSAHNCNESFTFLSRADAIRSRCHESNFTNWNEISQMETGLSPTQCKLDYVKMVESLKCAFSGKPCYCGGCNEMQQPKSMTDDNEIDLDDSSCDCADAEEHSTNDAVAADSDTSISAIDVNSPHLLFLGTGCATPSPQRGSSGIGLLMPTSIYRSETSTYKDALVLSAIIECGEGTLSSLSKHIESLSCHPSSLEEHLSYVNFIWISHAHLDHYGDVSSVVQAVAKAKRKAKNTRPVVLIAPAKVLKYLRVLMLKPSAQKIEDRQYIGITHREFQTSPFVGHVRSMVYDHTLMTPRYSSHPKNYGTQATKLYKPFASIQNVEVEHCREAYGLLLQMYIPMKGNALNSFVLCFSGDTRPSARLTKACQIYSQNNPISLLIHEATFLHDSQGREDAVRKRHSTVKEALDVATNIEAEACLLTHFSQRYTHVSVDDVSGDGSNSYKGSWGIACDGMLIPLTKRGMDSLLPLTKCIDTILSLPKI